MLIPVSRGKWSLLWSLRVNDGLIRSFKVFKGLLWYLLFQLADIRLQTLVLFLFVAFLFSQHVFLCAQVQNLLLIIGLHLLQLHLQLVTRHEFCIQLITHTDITQDTLAMKYAWNYTNYLYVWEKPQWFWLLVCVMMKNSILDLTYKTL